MNEFTLTILAVSIMLQLTAAVFALRLNRKISGVGHAWLLIAVALTLMAARRIVTFVGFFAPQVAAIVKGPVAESIALLIAMLILAGVLLIPRIFHSLQQITEALQTSEARYRALVNSAEDTIYSLDRDGRYTTLNASALRRFGWAEADFVGKTIRDFYPPEEAAFYEAQYAQVFETGQPTRFERRSINALGDFWYSISLSPIFDVAGEVVAISGVSRDITERVRVEEQLRLQSTALEAAANGIVITDRKGVVRWVNPAFTHLTGYTFEDILGQTLRILRSDRQEPQSFYKNLWDTILSGQVWHGEMTNRRKDNSLYIEEQTITPVRATGSEVTHFITIKQDITARKQLEQQAAEQLKRLQRLSELSMTLAGDPVEVFNHIARMIGELLDVGVVCLSEIRDEDLYFLSVYVEEDVITDAGRVPLDITPCATVVTNKNIKVYDHVAERFPKAEFLKTYNAFSYCGFPALDSDGNVVAVTCLLDDKPHDFSEVDKDLLRILGQRIGLEIERYTHLAEHRQAEDALRTHARQQAVVAELGQMALATNDLTLFMDEVVVRMSQTLAVEYVKVLELLPDGSAMLLRAGVGWRDGLVCQATVGTDTDSQAGYTLLSSMPVIVEDLRSETRFSGPALLQDHGVVSGMSVIIAGQEHPFGVLGAHTTQQRPFTDDDVHFLQAVANLLAEAVESSRLFEAERAARKQAERLRAATQALSRTVDLPQVFKLILTELQQVVPYDSASVQQLNGDQLEIIGGRGFPNMEELLGIRFDLTTGNNPNREVIRTRDIFIVDDAPAIYSNFSVSPHVQAGIRSWMGVPLLFGDQLIGMLALDNQEVGFYTQEQAHLALGFAAQAAIAIENARMFTAERAARQQAERLQAATQALSRTVDLPQVFELILSELQQVVPYDSASVQQLKEDQLEIIGGHGFPNLEELLGVSFDLTAGDSPNREVVRAREPLIVDDAPAIYGDFSIAPHNQAGTRSWLGVPLLFGAQLIGMLALDKQEVGFYAEEHARLVLGFAAQAAIAIENAKLYDQLRSHAATLEQRVTERTRELAAANEQLKELDRLKSKFVSDVSHELRTPITNLVIYLDLLERGKTERRARYIRVLKEETDRLQQLIEDILDLSRLEIAKGAGVEMVPVDFNEVVGQVVAAHQPRVEAANLRFTFESGADLPLIQGERNQLIQVVTNLVSNALNYTPVGNIQVSTYLDGDQVCLQVEDTGMGIEPEDRPHIFERFYRGQRASQSNIPGTGLGLGIVKEIVDLHKGEIEVQSEVGAGTVFRARFPVASGF